MKKYIYCALMALLCIACSKEDDPSMDTPFVIPQTLYAQTPIFESRALVEDQPISWDDSGTVDSRTYAVIDGGGATYTQYWSENDAFSVFFTTANLKYQFQSFKYQDSLDVGIFKLDGNETQGTELSNNNYYYAVYPYKINTSITAEGKITYLFSDNQTYATDSYANGGNGMVAIKDKTSEDNDLYFKNFCSYLQIRLEGNVNASSNKVKKITLTANDPGDKIAGTGYITITNGIPTVQMEPKASSHIITLDCGTGVLLNTPTTEKPNPEPINFWFVLPGDFTFTSGFEITVSFEDGSYFKKKTTKTGISIDRSHIKPMASFPIGEKPTTYESVRYSYNNSPSSNGTPFPINAQFFGENDELLVATQKFDDSTKEWVIYLSGPLKRIGGNIFEPKGPPSKYPNIKNITIETDDEIIIDDYAFYKCTADKIDVKTDIETIGNSAFAYCTVTEINIDGGIKTIEDNGFTSCSSLTTLNISSGVTHIGNNAFRDLSKLTSVSLNGVETIGYAAFQGCMGLASIEIPSTCISIGEGAFVATSIYEITCLPTTPPKVLTDNTTGDAYIFENYSVVYVPKDAVATYQSTLYWNITITDETGEYFAYTYLPLPTN